MTTQLSLYNNALVKHLGERKLSSLSENRKSRRVLDLAWDADFVNGVLEDGFWNFATRTIESNYDTDIDPSFGYKYGHEKPSDWVRTSALSLSDFFGDPLVAYNDEAGYWWVDQPIIFVRYVSDDAAYGGNLASWPESVSDYAELKLASLACMSITQDKGLKNELEAKADRQLKIAKGRDAMNDPVKFPPTGSWVRARRGNTRRGVPFNIRTV